MNKMYQVWIEYEHYSSLVWNARDKYTKWFKSKFKAILYAYSIKWKLKRIFKSEKKDNIIVLDINEYYIDESNLNEDFNGIVYSLNIINKY